MNPEDLKIVLWPDPFLAKISKPLSNFGEPTQSLIEAMFVKMNDLDGIGLAAPQVGHSTRLFIIHIPFNEPDPEDEEDQEMPTEPEWWHNKDFVFINPSIKRRWGKKMDSSEGCLSLPGITETIQRQPFIEVESLDASGQPFSFETDGLFSICIQHEFDHLEGKVFIDHLSRLKYQLLKKRILREQSEIS